MSGNRISRRPTRPQAALIAAAIVVFTVIGTGIMLQAQSPSGPAASAGTASTAAPSTGSSGDTAWAPLELVDLPVVATLEPSDRDIAGVAPGATFTLASRTGEPAAAIAARLAVSPAIELAVAPATDGMTATLTPKVPLAAGQTYRVSLRTPDGVQAGSWAFNVRGPVRVTSTIPGDTTTGVPVRTGIEVTFDQDGVADMQTHFAISPAVAGRFERHGRTQVFVPDTLEAATLYTVTIRRGLPRTGTDLALEQDVVVRFETEGAPGPAETRLLFGRDVLEVGPGERPVVAVSVILPESDDEPIGAAPATARVNVYRIPSVADASAALAAFLAAPHWSDYTDPLIPTSGLAKAVSFEANLEALDDETFLLRFPDTLDEGWYVVELPGSRVAHAFLQVTPISAWVAVMSDRTVVWVNDVATGGAAPGATITVEGGALVGRSGADGLMIAPTPEPIIPPVVLDDAGEALPSKSMLRVTSAAGKTVLVPFDVAGYGDGYRGEWSEKSAPADDTYWASLSTDRSLYRRDDTIEVWGYLRGRDDGAVPTTVDVRLVATEGDRSQDAPAVVAVSAQPSAAGSFTAGLRLASLPLGEYVVQAVVGGRVVVSRWVEVSIIRKPAYRLDLATDHTAVITGTEVVWTATATFFDGSPVPAADVSFPGEGDEGDHVVRTDASGKAAVSRVLVSPGDETEDAEGREDAERHDMEVSPTGPESAEIVAEAGVLVFPSAFDLQARGVVEDGRLKVSGSIHDVDLAKVERALAAGTWDWDAAGKAVGGRRIAVTVTELVPVRRQAGNDYDFIEKIVRPHYEYEIERRTVDKRTVVSDSSGRIRFSLAVAHADHEYEVVLRATDRAGRVQQRTLTAGQPFALASSAQVIFQEASGRTAGEAAYDIGERLTWRITEDGRATPSGGPDRYLYLIAQRGLRSAVVTDSSTFEHTFAAADAPGVFVIGVRFTGTTYAPKAAAWADIDPAGRAMKVAVTADAERYRPGGTATLSVRTTDASGKPVAASVVIEAVDEKLYAIGGADIPNPLEDLYGRVDSGIVRLTATHQVPGRSGTEGEGGDATGGGEGGRTDFKDTLLFREIVTDAAGRATTKVQLSDDLTSWHVTASAVTADLRAGVGELLIPVGLPFFVEATIADTYLASDRPVIALRAFGDALRAGDPVEFTVASTTLGVAPTHVSSTAFVAADFALPTLTPGGGSIVIDATATTRAGQDGKPLTDRLTRTFDVVESRLTVARTAYGTLGGETPSIAASSGLTTFTFTDAGRGRLVPLLVDLAEPGGSRLDRLIAQSVARRVLIEEFGRSAASLPELELDTSQYPVSEGEEGEDGPTAPGVGLLPWSGPDPWLAARIALTAPDAFDRGTLRAVLLAIRDDGATRRDLAIATLAGLASLGEPVLTDLQAARRETDLTTTERLYLALGFAAAGDDPSAIEIERALLTSDGERLGAWVRLRAAGDPGASLEATAMLAVLAAELGDPLAAEAAGYVADNPTPESVHPLDLVAYVVRSIERLPAVAASFAFTVDGRRTSVSLDPGETFILPLTSEQRSTLRLEPLAGNVGVAVEGRVVVAPTTLRSHPDLTLTRATPADPIAADRIVVIDLTATFAATAPTACYEVVELVPSGLAPIVTGIGEIEETGVTWPSSVVGQEVRFCAANDARTGHTAHLRYRARVVNEGTFAWEPAVMQLPGASQLVAVTPTTTVTIAKR